MTKYLYVSSEVQAILLKNVLIPQMKDGFWKNHRPSDHATQWSDVEIIVTTSQKLGPVDFKVPRLYNFSNPGFLKPNEGYLVSVAQQVKPSSNFRSIKKELIELSRIVGGRLSDKNGIPIKANRGNPRVSDKSSVAVEKTRVVIAKSIDGVKRTAVRRIEEPNVEIIKTSTGATVRRVAVVCG